MHRIVRATVVALAALCVPLAPSQAAPPPASAQPLQVPTLAGIVLLNSGHELNRNGIATPPRGGVDASRVTAIPAAAAQQAIRPFLGKPINGQMVVALRQALQDYFIGIHEPFVGVIVPPQVVDTGVLQVVVLVSRVGKVTVTGNKWFDAGQYTGALHARPGQPINGAQLDADMDWINQNQYRHAEVVAQPGTEVGTTDLQIRARDQFPLSITAGGSNTGTESTSLYRLNTGLDWGNAFWRGDDLNFNVSMSPDAHLVRQYALAYTANLPWHDTLTLSGDLAISHPKSGAVFGTEGRNSGVSLRYQANLPSLAWLKQHLTFGYDYKSSNSNLLFGGNSVFDTTSEIDQFVIGYGGLETDKHGSTSLDANLYISPGGITPDNTTAAFAAQQPGATANYAYANLAVERVTQLPAGFSWDIRGTLQLSDANLLPSEQMVFGGYASVRGFVEQGATRDNGVLLENELRLPPVGSLVKHNPRLARLTDGLVPFLFVDYGAGWNHDDLGGASSWLALSSIGPGVSWQIGRYVSLRFTYGIPLQRQGAVGPLLGPQFGVQITL